MGEVRILNSNRIKECTELSSEILKNFELSEIPVGNIILKCLRLCRLLGDQEGILLFTFESSGYPRNEEGYLTSDAWRISKIAGRRYFQKDAKTNKNSEYAACILIAEMEESIESQKIQLSSAIDPNISLSSSNPYQHIAAPTGNRFERQQITQNIQQQTQRLTIVKGALYNYVLSIYNKLVYGNIVGNVLS